MFKKPTLLVATLAGMLTVGTAPALAQAAPTVINCVAGQPCVGTSGNDTISAPMGQT